MFRFDRLSGLLARVAMCIGVCVALAGAVSFGAASHAADATVAPGGATALAPGVASAAPAGAADRTGAVPVVTARALIGLVLLGVLLWLIERTSGARTGRSSDLAPAAGAARADAGPGASGRLVQEVRAWADADLEASPAPAALSAVGTAPDEPRGAQAGGAASAQPPLEPSAQAPGEASAQATHEGSVQPGREPSAPDAPATKAEPAAASGAGDMPPPTALPTAAEPAPAATPRPAVFVSQPPLGLAATTATAPDATASDATASGAAASDAPASRPVAPAAAAAESATVPATEPGRPDDLTKVEGIGPKIAGLLKDAGIGSFAALANAPVPTLRQVLGDAGQRFAMHDPSTWPEQASLAARGDWDALASLQAALHGGRRAPGAPD
ncbi:MAG: helix-hairpin-helix domain-containing protein [Lautropia sp.]